jgi:hypothetical protein
MMANRQPVLRTVGAWTSAKHALKHPWHLVALCGATVSSASTLSPIVVLLALAGIELLVVCVISRLACYRRLVQQRLYALEVERCAQERAVLLRQMSDAHRRELTRLEAVVDRIRDIGPLRGVPAQAVVDDCLRLLASYVRLAIAHTVSRESLAMVDRRALDDEARRLEALSLAGSEEARELARGRLLVLRRRAETWDRSRECMETIAQQLAMIADLVQLAHEQFATLLDATTARDEIGRYVAMLDGQRCAVVESAEFAVANDVEPYVLDMGRTDVRSR